MMSFPMLASPAADFPRSGEWFAQPKLDGWRILACVDADGISLLGRRGAHYESAVPYLCDDLRRLPVGTMLDGEITGGSWNHVQSVMSRSTPHTPTDTSPALTYVVFDVLSVKGNDVTELPLHERLSLVESIAPSEHVIPIESLLVRTDVHESCARIHEAYVNGGLEGTVFKRSASNYIGGRSNRWLKFKVTDECEATITGLQDGRGEFEGLVGAMIVKLESGVETTISGFDMALRKAMTDNPSEYIGKGVELTHNGLSQTGKPRHPRFHRFRDDKEVAA